MFFSPRIRLKPLAQLCHRLATATGAGIKDLKIWQSEAERGPRRQRRNVAIVSEGLQRHKSLSEALAATGDFFPPLFRQMVDVGEVSGQLDRTYKQLAEHYDHTVAVRRDFLGRLTMPMLQLGSALLVIGVLIFVMGILPINKRESGPEADLLGMGLIGTSGLVVYLGVLLVIAIGIFLTIQAARRGVGWSRAVQRMAVRIPVLGDALKTLALSRFTWALQLVFDTPMDLRRAIPLALEASGNDYYAQFRREAAERIESGQDIHATLSATGVFPRELLDNIAVGEQSGQLVETMSRVSADYRVRANDAISILAQFAGYGIWLLVAIFIISMIFRLFSFYTDQIYKLL